MRPDHDSNDAHPADDVDSDLVGLVGCLALPTHGMYRDSHVLTGNDWFPEA